MMILLMLLEVIVMMMMMVMVMVVSNNSFLAPSSVNGVFWRQINPTPILLFRYSALTFNSHRIHYDHKYATETEGYPGEQVS